MKKVLLLLLFLFSFISFVHADCMRCKPDGESDLVCTGDTKYEIILKCGEPDYSEIVSEEKSGSYLWGEIKTKTEMVELIYYNCGTGQNIRILEIKGGKLKSIEDGDRGSGLVKCW